MEEEQEDKEEGTRRRRTFIIGSRYPSLSIHPFRLDGWRLTDPPSPCLHSHRPLAHLHKADHDVTLAVRDWRASVQQLPAVDH